MNSSQERLARLVKDARLAMGLSVRAAAAAAGMNRATWTSLENADHEVQERLHAGVERTLRWPLGTVRQILAGLVTDPPEPLPGQPGSPVFKRTSYVAAMLDEIAEEWTEDVLQDAWQLRETRRHTP